MRYMDLLKESKKTGYIKTDISTYSFFLVIFRWVSYLPTPFFIMLRISANVVTVAGFALAFCAAIVIGLGNRQAIALGIGVYFLSIIMDCIDGNITRVKNQKTYYGRFIDGLSDVAGNCFIQAALIYVAFTKFQNLLLVWLGLLSVVITPFYHFMFDRYSAYVRRMNQEKGTDVKPYIRRNISLRFMNLVLDAQFSFLIIAIFYFGLGTSAFFLINILIALVYISVHIRAAYKFLRVGRT